MLAVPPNAGLPNVGRPNAGDLNVEVPTEVACLKPDCPNCELFALFVLGVDHPLFEELPPSSSSSRRAVFVAGGFATDRVD